MSDSQLGVMYVFVGLLSLALFVSLEAALVKPVDAQAYADKLCQELYGPQTGHKWVDDLLMCETVRGEILQLRRK
jgi:hypothetical protein